MKTELKQIETAERLYRNRSDRYNKLSMWFLLPLFVGTICMSYCLEIGFILWIIGVVFSLFYCYMANKYLNKFRKEIDKIFKRSNKW